MKKRIIMTAIIMTVCLLALSGLYGCFGVGSPSEYKITYYVEGNAVKTITITADTTQITPPDDPVKEGHIFDGWYYDNNVWKRPFTQESISGGITSDIKLYARFIIDPESQIHDVVFKVGGVTVHTEQLTEGDTIPYDNYYPAKTGYTFVGWKLGAEEAPLTMGTTDIELDAVFEANKYKINFHFGAGEAFAAGVNLPDGYLEVTYDSPYATALSAITAEKDGKVFSHWQRNGAEYTAASVYNISGDIILTPAWAEPGTAGLVYRYFDGAYEVTNYVGTSTSVIIPMVYDGPDGNHVVAAIYNIDNLLVTSVTTQNSVEKIYGGAFIHCPNLDTVVIASSIQIIEADAFPPDSDIDIYCKASEDTAPDWGAGWACGNNAIYNNNEYAAKTFDLSNPANVVQTLEFDAESVFVSADGGVTYVLVPLTGYNISGKTLTLYSSYLDDKAEGNYIISVRGVLEAVFNINIYTDYLLIDYDKASNIDAIRNFTGENLTSIYGGGITADEYTLSTDTLTLHKEYLSTLKKGEYELLLKGADGFSEVLTLAVSDSGGAPYNVKLDCDLNYPSYTLLFDCDYPDATSFSYSVDGGAYSSCVSGDAVSALGTGAAHTLTVRCNANNKTSSYTLPAMTSASAHTAQTFTWQGITYNKYVADQSELNVFIAYLAHLGCTDALLIDDPAKPYGYVEAEVYVSDSLKAAINTVDSDCLDIANRSFDFAWSFRSSISVVGNIATFTIEYTTTPSLDYTTGYAFAPLTDNRRLATGSRNSSFNSFKINNHTKTETIDSIQELDSLAYGVKPIFGSSEALAIYNAALAACRTYIDDAMDDYRKVAVINDWLAENVTYDHDAIALLGLQEDVNGASTLTNARNLISDALVAKPYWSAILNPVYNKTTLAELKAALTDLLKGLKVFGLSGVFDGGIAVCDGYASAFKLMCHIEGIECVEVSGYAGEAHAWNKVKINGDWYTTDPTWARSKSGSVVRLTRQFMLITDEIALTGTNPHYEHDKYGANCIQILAVGEYDYYDNYNIGGGYDLVADSQAELNAIFAYCKAQGYNTAEFRYNIVGGSTTDNIATAVRSVENVSFYYVQPSNDKEVWLVDISNYYQGE